jgi:hypothetical protein
VFTYKNVGNTSMDVMCADVQAQLALRMLIRKPQHHNCYLWNLCYNFVSDTLHVKSSVVQAQLALKDAEKAAQATPTCAELYVHQVRADIETTCVSRCAASDSRLDTLDAHVVVLCSELACLLYLSHMQQQAVAAAHTCRALRCSCWSVTLTLSQPTLRV